MDCLGCGVLVGEKKPRGLGCLLPASIDCAGTAVELAIWRPISGSTYGRASHWMQALSDPWEQEAWRPRVDMPAGMTGAPNCLVQFGYRLFCEVAGSWVG